MSALRLRARLRALNTPAARAAATVVLAVLVLAGFLAAFLASRSRPAASLLERPVTVKRALSTTAALFGDRIEAEIDVYSDDRVVDPASVRVRSDFAPYRAVGTRVDRTGTSGLSLLRTRVVLACLTSACLPPRTAGRVLGFAPLTVTYRTKDGPKLLTIAWQPIQVLSRLPTDPTANIGVIDTAPPLDSGFTRSPWLLRGILIGVTALLGLAGAALVVTGLWPSAFSRRRRQLSPLEESLLEVETAVQRGDDDRRRRALDELATRLAEVPAPSLEARTRSLAWGPVHPEPQAISHLADDVRASVNGGSRR